jgi:hypothetical protein
LLKTDRPPGYLGSFLRGASRRKSPRIQFSNIKRLHMLHQHLIHVNRKNDARGNPCQRAVHAITFSASENKAARNPVNEIGVSG